MLGSSLRWRSTVAFTYLKVKSTKCLCLLPVVLVLSCYFGLGLVSSGIGFGLSLKNLVLFTLLIPTPFRSSLRVRRGTDGQTTATNPFGRRHNKTPGWVFHRVQRRTVISRHSEGSDIVADISPWVVLLTYMHVTTRNSDVADKPRDAFMKMQWRDWPPKDISLLRTYPSESLPNLVVLR